MLIAESNEGDNTKFKKVYVGPDVKVTKLSAPSGATAGQTIAVSDTTSNKGGAPTIVVTTTRFYLSANKKLDAADVPLGPGRTVPTLAPGSSSAGLTNVTIPDGTTPGAYYLIAKADDGGAVAESHETNNVKAVAIAVN
jgi:subtilase family serine protease